MDCMSVSRELFVNISFQLHPSLYSVFLQEMAIRAILNIAPHGKELQNDSKWENFKLANKSQRRGQGQACGRRLSARKCKKVKIFDNGRSLIRSRILHFGFTRYQRKLVMCYRPMIKPSSACSGAFNSVRVSSKRRQVCLL